MLVAEGTWKPLTEDLIRSGLPQKDSGSSVCTYLLRIEAEIISVQFVNVDEYLTKEAHGGPTPTYVALKPETNPKILENGKLCLNPSIEENLDLHGVLCGDRLDCIVLSRHYGLVVRQRRGVAERIGRVELYSRFRLKNANALGGRRNVKAHLRNYFPSSKREIVLG